jgi:glutamine amidotransferase-like uncharacterized protein
VKDDVKTIGLFVQHPKCSVQSCNGLIKALGPDYTYKVFTKHETEDNFFHNVDLVCFPGGVGDSDAFDTYFKHHGSLIHDYIKSGGRYLGICMGAYWADRNYLNILYGIESKQYIKRPGTCTRRSYSKPIECNWNGTDDRFFFYDGPAFIGNESTCDVIARYKNGDPAAIIQGRIGLIGPHLEAEEYWYDKPYLHRHWHQGKHHTLLKQFVDRLMEK